MPCDYKQYPNNWKQIRQDILERADNKCELCPAENHKPHWKTGSKVILTIHHIDGNKQNNNNVNLIALCQRCHLRLDLGRHINNRMQNKLKKLGQEILI
jgi:5-methylcytosine-specific restriction endonuclease McrA